MKWSETQPVRLWLYGLMGPIMALLVGYGILSDAQASMWIALGASALGVVGATEFARSKAYAPSSLPPSFTDGA